MAVEKSHSFCTHTNEEGAFPSADGFAHPDAAVDKNLIAEINRKYLEEALAWLTPEERDLICHIYMDQIPMTALAKTLSEYEVQIPVTILLYRWCENWWTLSCHEGAYIPSGIKLPDCSAYQKCALQKAPGSSR